MGVGDTEDFHHSLEELRPGEAEQIVESMTDTEIYSKVNNRMFQQDYIADYIEYLWDISKTSFWKHVKATLAIDQDLLWSDNVFHFKMLCSKDIPDDVFESVMDYAIECSEGEEQNFETIGCIIKAQAGHIGGLDKINAFVSRLAEEKQGAASERMKKLLVCECGYNFE